MKISHSVDLNIKIYTPAILKFQYIFQQYKCTFDFCLENTTNSHVLRELLVPALKCTLYRVHSTYLTDENHVNFFSDTFIWVIFFPLKKKV